MLEHKRAVPQKPARVVLLGSGGCVGQALANAAEKSSIDLIKVASKDINLASDHAAAQLQRLLRPEDCVIFAAAIDQGHASGSEALLENLLMARNVAAAVRGASVAHLIYLSSDAVYSPDASLLHEKTPAAAVTLYGAMHRTRELLLGSEPGVPLVILRLSAIYGASDRHNAYGPNRFMREAIQKKTITLFGDGEEMRDHLHADDATAIILAAACRQSIGLLNLVSGAAISFHDLAMIIARKTGAQIAHAPRHMPITHKHHDPTLRLAAFPSVLPQSLEAGLANLLKSMG